MMREEYTGAELEVVEIKTEDVIITSGETTTKEDVLT